MKEQELEKQFNQKAQQYFTAIASIFDYIEDSMPLLRLLLR